MGLTVAIVAPGSMGAAVGRRLTNNGVAVLTVLDGRSPASRRRADAAGMIPASYEEIASADFILSIVPPADAEALAMLMRDFIAAVPQKPIYVDCNAVNVETTQRIGNVIAEAGAAYIDGSIIGWPPRPGYGGPTFYLSGEAAPDAMPLDHHGLKINILDAPVGAASALKMFYGGITKGLTALAAAMVLGAMKAGAGDALFAELAESQPHLLERFELTLPDMFPKAYRWVAEMREISGLLAEDEASHMIYEGIAKLYERIAADMAGEQRGEIALLKEFLQI